LRDKEDKLMSYCFEVLRAGSIGESLSCRKTAAEQLARRRSARSARRRLSSGLLLLRDQVRVMLRSYLT
jgi:hypothetical protein